MAQSGRGYNSLQGYPSQASFASQPYPSFPIPPLPFHSSSTPVPSGSGIPSGEEARDSRHHSRNVIPGLGLGFSNNPVDWPSQSPGSRQQCGPVQSPAEASATTMPPLVSSVNTSVERTPLTRKGKDKDVFTSDNIMEDGEVCEDDSVNNHHGSAQAQGPEVPKHLTQGSWRKPSEPNNAPSVNRPEARGRSPSRNGQSEATVDMPISDFLRAKTVLEARKQARDSILRLWPLNVRYQNYLDEGIDESLLKSLFRELGFEAGPKVNKEALQSETAAKVINVRSDAPVNDGDRDRPKTAQSSEAGPENAPIQDKSEERKDRIARLLAAKGSKPSSSTSQALDPLETSHRPQSPQAPPANSINQAPVEPVQAMGKTSTQPMTQSDKSKLLHQKMEALKKARETRGHKRPHEDLAEPVMPASVSKTAVDAIRIEKLDPHPSANHQPAPSIPGLFLSTPQLSPVQQSIAGPHSVPTDGNMDDRPFKRPFAQTRKSRPFLIDVSDDEDDAEMDIDSPDHLASSIDRSATPLFSVSAKNALSLAENGPQRQVSSPIHTVSGQSSSDSSTKDDLESMKKKIEAMKQRIAEAEARKKAKQSLSQSPASTALNGRTQDDSSGAAGGIIHPIAIPPPVLPTSVLSQSPSQSLAEFSPSGPSHSSDAGNRHPGSKRPSLSRAASERLPLIEARRREQQLRLQLLQSQMAGIEREIQESLKEEERLKKDVSISESDDEQLENAASNEVGSSGIIEGDTLLAFHLKTNVPPPAAAPILVQPSEATSLVEAVDSAIMSPASSNSVERSKNATPAIADEPPSIATIAAKATLETERKQTMTTAPPDEDEDVAMQEGDSDVEEMAAGPREPGSSSSPSDQPPIPSLSEPLPAEQRADESEKTDRPTDPGESRREVDDSAWKDAVPTNLTPKQVESPKEATAPNEGKAQTGFAPYETPLQQFNAYRFHRDFRNTVAGGLRSLTYSNKVDVKKELCPDELGGRACPRGKQCEYQHFETMQAPDDQILLQLGACGSFDEKRKQEYNAGLRQLLIDFRNNKVKDFHIISQSIIDYRARFYGDDSKILPLGNVTI